MARIRPTASSLIERIERELTELETRRTELHHARKVIRELVDQTFTPTVSDADIVEVLEPKSRISEPVAARVFKNGEETDDGAPPESA